MSKEKKKNTKPSGSQNMDDRQNMPAGTGKKNQHAK